MLVWYGSQRGVAQVLAAKFVVIFRHLRERQRRLLMAAEARALGHGGIRLVARAAGVREATVSLGRVVAAAIGVRNSILGKRMIAGCHREWTP